MTVSSSSSRIAYVGDGTTTAFAFPYEFSAGSDLKVYKAGVLQTITTHYTVSGGGGSSGTVTFVTAPAASESIVIYDDPPVTQLLDYIANDPFPAESHEGGLDKLTRIARRFRDMLTRTLRLSDSDVSGASTVLPTPSAQKILGWNAAANALVNYSASDLATVAVYGAAQYQEFSGNGATTAFTLSSDPGSVNNLDIDISGVSQRNGIDFTVSGANLTFTSAPPTGTNNIHAKWMQALPQGITNANAVNYTPAGSGAEVRTVESALRDDVHLSDKGTSADMLTALNRVATDFSAGGHCQIEAGTWTLSDTFTFAGQRLNLHGKGRQVSIVSFQPASAKAALVVNELSAGGSNQGSICGLGFTAGSNTQDKTAIRLVNVANWDIGHIGIATNAWQGDSIGIKTEGRQLLYIHDSEIACARPIVIGNNATFPSISADHSLIDRCELVGTSATRPCIEFEDGTSFGNMTIRNCAIVKGQHGIYWNDTTSTAAGYAFDIEDIRTEQGLDPTGYSIYLASTAQNLQSLHIRNAHLDNAREGIYLRNAQRVTLENVAFTMGAGRVAMDMTFIAGSRLVMINCFKQTGSTFTLTNARCVRRERVTDVGMIEEWVYDSGFSAGSIASEVYHGGVPFTLASGATQAIADNSFTGIISVSTSEDVSALFELRGATQTTRELVDNAGFFSQTQGTATSVNIYWDAGTSRYRLENNRAGTVTFSVFRIGTSI